MTQETRNGKRTWSESFEVASNELVDRVKELIREGNVRRLIIKRPDGRTLMEIPLTAGVVAGAALTIWSPVIAAVGALAAMLAKVKIEVVRTEGGE
jgi:hypothetical protein